MTILAPPKLPDLLEPVTLPVLKPTTRAHLRQTHTRVRVTPDLAQGATITLYNVQEHGLDVLAYLWASLQSRDEHLQILGALAAKPMEWLKHFVGVDLFVVHTPAVAWQTLDGVMAFAWGDDTVPKARYRCHFYVFPDYRHPLLTRQLYTGMLHHLFEERGFHNVWGLTPVTNKLALRFLRRMGIAGQRLRKDATIDPVTLEPIDCLETWITREAWRQWQAVSARSEKDDQA